MCYISVLMKGWWFMNLSTLSKKQLIKLKFDLMLKYISFTNIDKSNYNEVNSLYNKINEISHELNKKLTIK